MALNLKENTKAFYPQLEDFSRINLTEMNQARLMNRIDQKFILNTNQLNRVIKDLGLTHDILEINNLVNQSYTSYYFDTLDYQMYLSHHNKRLNRYKIRQRFYNTTGHSFLEIKHKNNKGVTDKKRIKTEKELKTISLPYFDFIQKHTKYNGLMLQRVLENNFDRITLTNKQRNQRITIDTNLSYWLKSKPLSVPNLAIIEVKSTRNNIDQTIFNLLKFYRIKPTGFSKYSIGLALLKPELKQNLFKQKIHILKKICNA